jgi:hypothetical protein
MSICTNCKSRLSCGCQKRTAKDGKSCCNGCVHGYNATIQIKQQKNTTVKAPSNITTVYKGPGTQL